MKKQNFYPKQVLRAMAGKDVQTLDAAQRHALQFFMRRSRQYGIPVAAIQTTDIPDLRIESVADFEAHAAAILANCKTRIFLKPAKATVPKGVFVDAVPFIPQATA